MSIIIRKYFIITRIRNIIPHYSSILKRSTTRNYSYFKITFKIRKISHFAFNERIILPQIPHINLSKVLNSLLKSEFRQFYRTLHSGCQRRRFIRPRSITLQIIANIYFIRFGTSMVMCSFDMILRRSFRNMNRIRFINSSSKVVTVVTIIIIIIIIISNAYYSDLRAASSLSQALSPFFTYVRVR